LSLDVYLKNGYLRAGVLFVGLLFVLRLILGIGRRAVLKLTSKTKTDIDDMLVKKSSGPLTVVAFMVAVRISLAEITMSDALVVNIANTLYSVIVIAIGSLVYSVVDILLIRAWKKLAAKTKARTDETLTSLIHGILKGTIFVLVALYILDLWGVKIVPLLGALGIAGLAVALALQPVLANIFSGVSMILDKSIRMGDWVVLPDGKSGVIQKIGIRSTKIKSWDNELIIVPNTTLANSQIQNISLPEPRARVVIPFGVAYGSDVEKVKKVVINAVKKVKHVVKDAEPVVRFLEMGDSSLKFKAYFYVETFEVKYGSIDEANTLIYNALNKAKIEIPFPQMDVHLKK